jgi:hypothetical protein
MARPEPRRADAGWSIRTTGSIFVRRPDAVGLVGSPSLSPLRSSRRPSIRSPDWLSTTGREALGRTVRSLSALAEPVTPTDRTPSTPSLEASTTWSAITAELALVTLSIPTCGYTGDPDSSRRKCRVSCHLRITHKRLPFIRSRNRLSRRLMQLGRGGRAGHPRALPSSNGSASFVLPVRQALLKVAAQRSDPLIYLHSW